MIKLVTRFEEEPILDPNYIKIAASIKAYGTGRPFCTVWRTGGTLLCRIDGHFTIYGDDFSPEELRDFLSAVGASGITCLTSAAQKLGFDYREYNVMCAQKGLRAEADFSPSCDEVYELLALGTDGDIVLPERTAFIADLSHRIRHGTALACVYKSTVCVMPYMIDSAALICGVSAGVQRGSGFAGMCVSAAVFKAARPVLTVCSDALVGFYKRFGFETSGKIAEIIF